MWNLRNDCKFLLHGPILKSSSGSIPPVHWGLPGDWRENRNFQRLFRLIFCPREIKIGTDQFPWRFYVLIRTPQVVAFSIFKLFMIMFIFNCFERFLSDVFFVNCFLMLLERTKLVLVELVTVLKFKLIQCWFWIALLIIYEGFGMMTWSM